MMVSSPYRYEPGPISQGSVQMSSAMLASLTMNTPRDAVKRAQMLNQPEEVALQASSSSLGPSNPTPASNDSRA